MKGAEVGIIREGTFVTGSSPSMCWGCGGRKPKPGGTDGVDDLDACSKPINSSKMLSATSASTDDVASSRDGRPWSSKNKSAFSQSSLVFEQFDRKEEKHPNGNRRQALYKLGCSQITSQVHHGSIIVFEPKREATEGTNM